MVRGVNLEKKLSGKLKLTASMSLCNLNGLGNTLSVLMKG